MKPPKLDAFEIELTRKSAFFNFTRTYFGTHDTNTAQDWMPDDAALIEFHDYL